MFKAWVYFTALVIFTSCSTEKKQVIVEESLQDKLHKLSVDAQEDYNASVVYITVMDSSNGNLIGVVDSSTKLEAYKKDETVFEKNMLRFAYEPGSVIKPFFYALALDQNITSPSTMVNCFNGEYKIGKNKVITDHYKFDKLSAEDVIVHSSNIGIVQITKDMRAFDMNSNLTKFGFGKAAIFNYEDLGEDVGYIPHTEKLNNEIYKATTSYGYGIYVNLLQLIRAYSVFNNDGNIIYPKDQHTFKGTEHENTVIDEPEKVIKLSTATKVKNALIETVNRGTGKLAKYDGFEVGGKTGTSHIVEDGRYVNKYYNTFIGFANGQKNRYVIGVLIVDPRKEYFASKTAASVFSKVIDLLVINKFIK